MLCVLIHMISQAYDKVIPSERGKSPNASYYDSVTGKIQNKDTSEDRLVII